MTQWRFQWHSHLSQFTGLGHNHNRNTHTWTQAHAERRVWTSPFYRDKGDRTTVNEGNRHSAPLRLVALTLYRLADHEHEVISSTPEADGIALLYSNSQGRGGCVPLCPFFFFALFSFLSTPDSSQTSCSAKSLHPPSYPINIYPQALSLQSIFFSFYSPSLHLLHRLSLPPLTPRGSTGYAPHSTTRGHVTRAGSIRVHLLLCAV